MCTYIFRRICIIRLVLTMNTLRGWYINECRYTDIRNRSIRQFRRTKNDDDTRSFMHLFVLFRKHISPVADKNDKVTFTSKLYTHTHNSGIMGPRSVAWLEDWSLNKTGEPLIQACQRTGKDIRRHKSVALHFAPVVISNVSLSIFPRNSVISTNCIVFFPTIVLHNTIRVGVL